MKLVTFEQGGARHIGVLIDGEIADVTAADDRLPTDMTDLLAGGADALAAVEKAAASAGSRLALDAVKLCSPVPRPRKYLGLGFSYRTHVQEIKDAGIPIEIPDNQVWFNKQVSCIVGPYDDIHLPKVSGAFDYEGEMAVVIGKRCRHVKADQAMDMVAGYTITNDLSIRDWQMRAPTATLGKSFDTHGPIGPWLLTRDEMDHPENLRVRTWVDDDLRQDGNTSDFIYSIGQMIEELTTVFTLEPGDVLATGTPSGVGAAFRPPKFLTAGQLVKVEIEGLGHIANRVIPEPDNFVGG